MRIGFCKSVFALLSFCAVFSCTEEQGNGITTRPVVTDKPDKPFQIVTIVDRSKALSRSNLSVSQNASSSNVLVLDETAVFQEIDGFGAAVTGSTCYNLMRMTKEDRASFLKKTFSVEDGFGMNYIRISIGCSDFSLSEYTCCDKEGMENFALTDEETKYVIPVLKEILAINPDVKIMGSPWTCPRWMKVYSLDNRVAYNSWTGGQLNPDFYQDYAEYFVKWIQAFEQEGIPIYSVTLQNEPLHRGNSASLYMSWEEQRDFIATAVGPAFSKVGIKARIYAYDHNYNYANDASQSQYPLKIYADPEASRYLAGAAYHNYGGSSSELLNVHNNAPEKELVFSEASIGEWNDGHNIETMLPQNMRDLGLGTVNRWCRGVIVWNLMLDSEKGPNRPAGCKSCYGAVDISKNDYKTITYNSHYYMLAHLSGVVRTGAHRIGNSNLSVSGLTYGTFCNADGSYAAVLLNESSSEVAISLTSNNKNFVNCRIPANSVVSVNWKE